MVNNTETTTVKTEFVNVITKRGLVSSPVSTTFSTKPLSLKLLPSMPQQIKRLSSSSMTKFLSMQFYIEHLLKIN